MTARYRSTLETLAAGGVEFIGPCPLSVSFVAPRAADGDALGRRELGGEVDRAAVVIL